MNLNCPVCQSENTQKLSLAVEGGTFRTSGQAIGVGGGGSGIGALAGTSKSKSLSKTAEKHAEPEKAQTIQGPLAIIVVAALSSLFFGSGAITVGLWLAGAAMVMCFLHNTLSFPKQRAAWDAKFICQRCAHVFTPGSDGEAADA